MLVWLMGHFAGRPTVEGKVTREELITFGVLSDFAKVRHIHYQEKVLVNLLSFVFFFHLSSAFLLSAFSQKLYPSVLVNKSADFSHFTFYIYIKKSISIYVCIIV